MVFSHLGQGRHPLDLLADLVDVLLADVLWRDDDRTALVVAADLLPVGARGLELGRAHHVDATELAQEEVLKGKGKQEHILSE